MKNDKRNKHIEDVLTSVGHAFNIDPVDMVTPGLPGSRDVSTGRQVAAILLNQRLGSVKTGQLLGKRGHQYASGARVGILKRGRQDSRLWKRVVSLCHKYSVEIPH